MEKIRITADDIARSDASAPVQPAPSEPEISISPAIVAPRRLMPWIVGVSGAGILVIALALAFFFTKTREPSLDEWKDAERQHLNAELASSPKLKPYIENIHPLVTFTGAAVKSIAVTTVDGTKRTGKGGSNIAEVEFVVTYHWEGPVQKNGYTEVLYVWDMQGNRLKTSRYLDSTAVMNLDNIDWFKLGLELAPSLFGGN
jgi:hypothetical protein